MKKLLLFICLFSVLIPLGYGQVPGRPVMATPGQGVAGMNVDNVVEMELMTQVELADKVKNGWSVLVPAGGTEIRGPHAIIGVHTILSSHRAIEAAKRLGKTIVAPTLPFAVAATGGFNATQWKAFEEAGTLAPNPGAIQVSAETFKGIQQGIVESLMYIGFKDIFLMGDHGGGQNEMRAVAEEMTAKFGAKGIRVHYVPDFYSKTHEDIDMYMYNHKLPIAGHGGMMETAEMMYWEPTQYAFIRPIFKTVPFDGTRFEGDSLAADLQAWKARKDAPQAPRGAGGGGGGARGGAGNPGAPGAVAGPPRVNNALSGNPHPATKEIGKDLAEIGVANTVNQIKALLAARK